jgi:hypothetical protein
VYPQLPEPLQREWAVLDTHDGLTDWYKHKRSLKQICQALQRVGAVDMNIRRGGNGIEAFCRRSGE